MYKLRCVPPEMRFPDSELVAKVVYAGQMTRRTQDQTVLGLL